MNLADSRPAGAVGVRPRPSARNSIGDFLAATAAVFGVSHLPILATVVGLSLITPTWYVIDAIAALVLIFLISAPTLFRVNIQTLRLWKDPVGAGFLLLILASALSCLNAYFNLRGNYAMDMWRQYAMAFSLLSLFFIYKQLSKKAALLKPILVGWDIVTLVTIGTILAHLAGFASGEVYGARQFGILGDAVAWLLSALSVMHFARRKWLTFAICGVLLALTESRAPALFAAAGILLSSILQPAISLATMFRRVVAAGGFMGALVIAPVLLPNLAKRFEETDFFYNDRIETLRFGFQLFLESPWLGLGYNAQPYYFAERLGVARGRFMILTNSVSTPMQILTDFGIIGFALFMVAIIALLRACFIVARTPPVGIPKGPALDFFNATRGLACWLMPFLVLNHAAAYLTPQSLIGVVVFSAAGMVVAVASLIQDKGLYAGFRKARAGAGPKRGVNRAVPSTVRPGPRA